MSRFLTLEMIHTLPYSCANRDQSSAPKTAQYPGGDRARISSQSFKRQQRIALKDLLNNEGFEFSDRSRALPRIVIAALGDYEAIIEEGEVVKPFEGMTALEKRELVGRFFVDVMGLAIGSKEQSKTLKEYFDPESADSWDERSQIILHFNKDRALNALLPQIHAFKDAKMKKTGFDTKKILTEALSVDDLVDVALFGIMLASSDLSLRTDGAISVAQTVTVHPMQLELDFWTAMGDVSDDSHMGGENMGTALFSHGVFYSAQTIDLDQLRKNLPGFGDDEIAKVIEYVIRTFVGYRPQAKRTNSAPFAEPDLVMATISDRQVNHSSEFYSTPVSFDDDNISRTAAERLVARALRDQKTFGLTSVAKELDTGIVVLDPSKWVDENGVNHSSTVADFQRDVTARAL